MDQAITRSAVTALVRWIVNLLADTSSTTPVTAPPVVPCGVASTTLVCSERHTGDRHRHLGAVDVPATVAVPQVELGRSPDLECHSRHRHSKYPHRPMKAGVNTLNTRLATATSLAVGSNSRSRGTENSEA